MLVAYTVNRPSLLSELINAKYSMAARGRVLVFLLVIFYSAFTLHFNRTLYFADMLIIDRLSNTYSHRCSRPEARGGIVFASS